MTVKQAVQIVKDVPVYKVLYLTCLGAAVVQVVVLVLNVAPLVVRSLLW